MTIPDEESDWFHETRRDPTPDGRRSDPLPNGTAPLREPAPSRPADAPMTLPPPDTSRAPDPLATGAPIPTMPTDDGRPLSIAGFDERAFEPIRQQAPAAAATNLWEEEDYDDGLAGCLPVAPASQNAVQIGLWGQPESGKTTFLTALRIAAAQQQGRLGPWRVHGLDNPSSDFLVEQTRQLTRLHEFPEPSQAVETLRWSFNGPIPGRLLRRHAEFVLSVQDMPGEAFRQGAVVQRVVDHLARSRGLIYLFDPITLNTDNIEYFDQTLQMLSAAMNSAGHLHKGRLPQYLSVCVTKFDEPAFFNRAVREGWVTQDDTDQRLPRVADDRAEAFFDWVCHVLRRQGAPLIRDLIRANFHDVRVKYFVTSSVGFRLNRQQIFDSRDFRNVDVGVDRRKRIREMVRPINVLEPLISLERAIRG